MNTKNLSTLNIHKLTKAQYDRELAAGRIDEDALYLVPDTDMTDSEILARLGDLGTNIQSNSTAIGEHIGKISANETNIANLSDRIEEVNSKIDTDLGDVVSTLEQNLNDGIGGLTQRLNDHAATSAETYATKAELNSEAGERANADAALAGRIATLETASATHATISALADEISARTTQDEELAGKISALDTHVADTYTLKTDFNSTVSTLGKDIDDLDKEIENHIGKDPATSENLGHVKLSDTPDNSLSVSSKTAATPKAVYAVSNNLQSHIAEAAELYIYTGDEVLLNSSIPINADTVGGMTVDKILAEARGEGTATGTVGYSSATPSNPTSVTLTNVTSGDHLYPKTNTASITDFSTATSSFLKFAKGTTEPTKAVGTIWFYGSAAPYQIRIYNGSAWEVVNSWQ